jgi:hypothetical protein
VRELSRAEFLALFEARFPYVEILRQRTLSGSALLSDSGSAVPPLVFDRRGDTHFEACVGLPRAPYLVAVASDVPLPPLPASLYVDRSDLDTDGLALVQRGHALAQVEAALAKACHTRGAAESRAGELHAALTESNAALATATASAQASEVARVKAVASADVTAHELETLRGSARTFLRGYLPRLRRHLLG